MRPAYSGRTYERQADRLNPGRLGSAKDIVMAGLVPAIHAFAWRTAIDVDARDTSAFTRVFDALCAGMTLGLTESLICG